MQRGLKNRAARSKKSEATLTKANGSGSLDDLSEQAFEIAKRRQAAANEAMAMLEEYYETAFESHAATLLRAMAWLAGTSLYRSFGFLTDMPPGSPVLSDQSNGEGMKLLKDFMFLMDRNGIKLKSDEFTADIPAEHKPRMNILRVQEQFQSGYNGIMEEHGFDYLEGGRTGAVACARLVRLHCQDRKDLEPKVAASIVSMGFVEGSKTAPAPLK